MSGAVGMSVVGDRNVDVGGHTVAAAPRAGRFRSRLVVARPGPIQRRVHGVHHRLDAREDLVEDGLNRSQNPVEGRPDRGGDGIETRFELGAEDAVDPAEKLAEDADHTVDHLGI